MIGKRRGKDKSARFDTDNRINLLAFELVGKRVNGLLQTFRIF